MNLSALFTGQALVVYALLPQENVLDYAVLKTALLKRYEKTEDGFRNSFRKCRLDVGETFSQVVVRLRSYLDGWIEMGRVDKSYHGLYDLVFTRSIYISM